MDVDEEQRTKRQRDAKQKRKEAATRQAIIDEILAQGPKPAPDRSPILTRTARAIPAERLTLAKPKATAYASGAGLQHRAMHTGSTALRTPAALMIEKTAMLAEHVEEEPVAEEKENQAMCPAAPEHSMLNAEEQVCRVPSPALLADIRNARRTREVDRARHFLRHIVVRNELRADNAQRPAPPHLCMHA